MRERVLALAAMVALSACTTPAPSDALTVRVVAMAGPTCPVVSDPPDPNCDDRPVEGAAIVVQDEGGAEVARLVTDGEGMAVVELPAGPYVFVPQPVEGLMGTAPSIDVSILDGLEPEPVMIVYDTGIR